MNRFLTLVFDTEIVERQRLLDGAEHVWLEGRAAGPGEPWMISLNYARPKESGAPMEEGDLSLEGPDGNLEAALETGRIEFVVDEVAGDERELLALGLRVQDGEGAFQHATGSARIRGEVSGDEGRLELTLELE